MTRLPGETPRDWFVRVVGERNAARDDPNAVARYEELKLEAEQARAQMQGEVMSAPREVTGGDRVQPPTR
jgi:hypothetical protein